MPLTETRAEALALLVTGSQGFVGRHVRSAIARRGGCTLGVDRPGTGAEIEVDLSDAVLDPGWVWDQVGRARSIRSVIFLAANISRSSSVDAAARANLRLIAEAPVRLIEEGARRGVCAHLVNCSTFKLFGPQRQPLIDAASHPRRPDPFSYGSAKALSEYLLRIAASRARFAYAMVHPTCIYGPGQHLHNAIPVFLAAALRGESPVVYGDGSSLRDDVYVVDLADILVEAALRHSVGSFHATGERSHTLRQLAEACCQAAATLVGGTPPEVHHDPSQPSKWWLDQSFDSAPTRRTFGYQPTPLIHGLRAEAAWLRAGRPADTERFTVRV
jgi:nucleoside-diphosphate-sugar epimerase